MNRAIKSARDELAQLLEGSPVTAGLHVHVRGRDITLAREPARPDGSTERDDRVRLTHLGDSLFGLSVLRHTGRWQKTPFSGSVAELFEVICGPMQHLVADWP